MNTWMMFPMTATTKRGVGAPGLVCRLYGCCAVQVCHNHDTLPFWYIMASWSMYPIVRPIIPDGREQEQGDSVGIISTRRLSKQSSVLSQTVGHINITLLDKIACTIRIINCVDATEKLEPPPTLKPSLCCCLGTPVAADESTHDVIGSEEPTKHAIHDERHGHTSVP